MRNDYLTRHDVAPIMLDTKNINELLLSINVRDVLQTMFHSLASGNATQPPQSLSVFPKDKGDFITYTGVIDTLSVFGAKLSPYIITGNKPIVTAWTYLMSSKTGQPLLCCDSSALTTERTAGTTALAISYLAPKTSRILTIIGSGEIALAHLRHALSLREWTTIRVYSPSLVSNKEKQQAFTQIDSRVSISTSKEKAVDDSDVIMLCTSSGTPVINNDEIKSSAVVTSISTNVANAHEIQPSLLTEAEVYCDYKVTTPDSAGEMKIATQLGSWSKDFIRGDLSDLVAETCELPSYTKPIFFRSLGLGLEDIAIAYGVWELLQEKDK